MHFEFNLKSFSFGFIVFYLSALLHKRIEFSSDDDVHHGHHGHHVRIHHHVLRGRHARIHHDLRVHIHPI